MKKTRNYIVYILFILIAILVNIYGFYYDTPEKAIEKYYLDNQLKVYIETSYIKGSPIVFYISKEDTLCIADYKVKEKGDKKSYKVKSIREFNNQIDKLNIEIVYNTFGFPKKNEMPDVERILLGVNNTPEYESIISRGMKLIIKEFSLNGKQYRLWYLIGGVELDDIIGYFKPWLD